MGKRRTLFGNEECFPCLSPSASACPGSPVLCTGRFLPSFFFLFFCHCAFTQHGCWCWRDYNRAFHFFPPPPSTHPLQSPDCSCLGHSWRISPPYSPRPPSLLSPGLLAAKTHHPFLVLCIWAPGPLPQPHPLMSHLFIFVHICLPSHSPRARVTSRHHPPVCCPASL